MSTPQHPLTDETRDRLVSYISGGTIDCSSEEGRYDALSEDDARTIVESLWEPMMQAVQAAALNPLADLTLGTVVLDVTIRGYGEAGSALILADANGPGVATAHGFYSLSFLTAFTTEDGRTRVRRDGEHENGEPRFVKEGEK